MTRILPVFSLFSLLAFSSVAESQQKPRLHVLAIGVDSEEKQKRGHYADDAEAVGYLLQKADPATFSGAGTRVILRGLDATHDEVLNKLRNLRDTAVAEDTSVVFFSTHGRQSDDGTDLNLYVADGPFTGKQLLEELVRIPGKIVVLMDTCRAGAILQQMDSRPEYASISLLLATQADEDSWGVPPEGELRHGIFVNALREGLLGLADDPQWNGNGDGVVSLRELGHYASQRASSIFPRQQAALRPDPDLPEWPLVTYCEADKNKAVESWQHTFFTSRNPWREPDVIDANDYRVRTLAAKTTFPEPDKDENATAWPKSPIAGPLPECLEGEGWAGLWKPDSSETWFEGKVEIHVDGTTMYVRFEDGTNAYLFEILFLGTKELGGVTTTFAAPWMTRAGGWAALWNTIVLTESTLAVVAVDDAGTSAAR